MKKLVSLILTAAMLLSVFPTVSMAETTYSVLYENDYEAATAENSGWTSASYPGGLSVGTDNTKYIQYAIGSQNTRSATSSFSVDLTQQTQYVIEFDMALTKSTKDDVQFAIASGTIPTANTGITSNYIFKINMTAATNNCTINDMDTAAVTLTDSAWYHYNIMVDTQKSLETVTITDTNGTAVANKIVVPTNGTNNKITGALFLSGRYYSVMKLDNILVRTTTDSDVFGEIEEETLSKVEFTSALGTVITQPASGSPVHKPITVKATGIYGGDLTDKVSIEWSTVGLENEDGYISLTAAEGSGEGTEGSAPSETDTTAYFNVRNGVSNWFGEVKAKISYLGDTFEISTPFAVTGASGSSVNIAPTAGYPESMNDYADGLIGYTGTATGLNDKDLVLNNWSIYGSNGARTLTMNQDSDGTKYLRFASNGGSGSTVGVYQLADQSSQYIVDMKVRFTGGTMAFGHYSNTPNNTSNNPNWACSYAGGTLTVGTQSVSNLNSTDWFRIIASADESADTCWVKVYNSAGSLVGEVADEPLLTTSDSTQKYFCFYGTYPVDLASFRIYYPTASGITINSEDTVQVPETAGEQSEIDLSAVLKDTDGYNMTGTIDWSLDDEYAGVAIASTGAQTAKLSVTNEAGPIIITVTASCGGKTAEKEISLSTTGNSVVFTKSSPSITIPFSGEENAVAEFVAEARKKDTSKIDGAVVTYEMVDAAGEAVTSARGITFDTETGTLTVEPGAASKVVYIKASTSVTTDGETEQLSAKVKVNIHGLSFAFGSDAPSDDSYTQVTSADAYTDKIGYGFADTSAVTDAASNVTGTADYRFKTKVPNGNYAVSVTTTSAAITSEVVETVSATTGISKSGSTFNVAVCDGVLDLTFTSGSTLSNLTITQATAKTAQAKPSLYAIGDSTTNNTASGAKSWGNCLSDDLSMLPDVFGGFSNNGMAGRDSVSFYNQGRVETVLLNVCPGDYVTVNMGINSKETNEASAYYTLLSQYYVQAIIDRGAVPVIVTATPQGPVGNYVGNYSNGVFTCNRGDGARNDVLRQIAQEKSLNIIELGNWGDTYFNSLTADDVTAYNAANGTSFTTILELVQSWYVDHNHYTAALGNKIAEYLLSELSDIVKESKNTVIYSEELNWVQASGIRNGAVDFASSTNMPDITTVTLNLNMTDGTDSAEQRTLALMTDAGALTGLQYVLNTGTGTATIKAWTGWTGNANYNQLSDVDNFKNGKIIKSGYTSGSDIKVSFTIDKINKIIVASCDGTQVQLPYTISPTAITGLKTGVYRKGAMTVSDVTIEKATDDYLAILGDDAFAKVSGSTVTRTYKRAEAVVNSGETFSWNVSRTDGKALTGIMVSDGVLEVNDTAEPGTVTITCTSNANSAKTANFDVTIGDFQQLELTADGPKAYNLLPEETGTYKIISALDMYDDDVSDMISPVWTSSNTSVATINSATGVLSVIGTGSAVITGTVTNGTAVSTVTVNITVSAYSLTGDASGNSTAVDTSALISNDTITGYLVTTATADGTPVKSTTAAKSSITGGSYTVDTTGADRYEIAPVFETAMGTTVDIPADRYNVTVTVNNGARTDVYVNDQLIFNNLNQAGDSNMPRTIAASADYTANDVVISQGYAKFNYQDDTSNGTTVTNVKFVKSPSIVTRAKRIYVIGDSLVATYYGDAPSGTEGLVRTGFGQVLENYIKGNTEVTNLGNSGAYAKPMLETAFTNVKESAQTGDILILESGYNDRSYSTESEMKAALREMYNDAAAKGVKVIFVSPNASHHDYKGSVSWTSYVEDVAAELNADYIDLSQLSYDFLYGKYGDGFNSGSTLNDISKIYNVSDRLHTTYNGAMLWASFIAQGLHDLGYTDIVDTEYSYTFSDGTEDITAQVADTVVPTTAPTAVPTATPTAAPTAVPTAVPTATPTAAPTAIPTAAPTVAPTAAPTAIPTAVPTTIPTVEPTAIPTTEPTVIPTVKPTTAPSAPTVEPTVEPTIVPTVEPTAEPTAKPTVTPTASPMLTPTPTAEPTSTPKPTEQPTPAPVTSGTDGSISWDFVSGELTISGTGAIPDYSVGTAPWYHLRGGINKITIQQGINTIGENAFNGLANVTDISIPIGVNQINNGAFEGCGKLKTITLPESMNAGIGSGAFRDCTGITTITVPSGVKTIEQGAFEGCTNITEITLPFIGSQVGSVNNTDTFDYIFNGKVPSTLKKVTITNETNVPENAFKDLSDIENITINSGIKSIGNGAFDGCSALKQFVIPDGITAIGDNTFRSCESASIITVPDTVNDIGESAFDGCKKLRSINIPSGVTVINNNTFRGCESLTAIIIPNSVTNIGENVLTGCNRIYTIKIPFVGVNANPGSTEVTENGLFGYLFGCANSDIPAAVTKVEITGTDASNYIPKEAFKDCGFIEDIIIDGGIAVLDNAFRNCKNLKHLYIPRSISTIGETILADCTRLETLIVPFIGFNRKDQNTETSVLGGFFGYNDMDITGIIQYYNENGDYHFYKIPRTLKDVSVLNQTDIPAGAFSECKFIEKVAIVTGASMGNNAFYHCASLKTVTLPNDLQTIGAIAFAECENLETINIPNKVKIIGEQAFYNDRALKNVTIPDSVTEIADDVFNGTDLFSAANLMANGKGMITCSQDSAAYNYAVDKGIATNVVPSSELNVKKTSTTVALLSDNSFLFDITDSYNMSGILHVELYDSNSNLIVEKTMTANDVEYRVEFSAMDMSDVSFARIYISDTEENMVSTQVETVSVENGDIPEIPESNIEMLYENGVITFTGTMIRPVVLLQAIYNDNGSLNKVNTYSVTSIDEEVTVDSDFENGKVKFMLWDSIEKMKPIAEAIE